MTTQRPGTSVRQVRLNQRTIAAQQAAHGPLVMEVDESARPPRLRLLPVVMVLGGLFLGFKLASIYTHSEYLAGFMGMPFAVAQDASGAGEAAQTPQSDPSGGPQLGPGRSLLDNVTQEPLEAPEGAVEDGQAEAAAGETDEAFDPMSLTQSELDLLQSLADRRKMILRRESEVELRENLLHATEQRIDEKIIELKKIEQTISSLIRSYDEQQEKQLRSLVKIYETMKPKAAAAIFETLEMHILLDVVERMKEAKLALVLQQVSPDRAKEITTELRARRQLPGELTGG